MTSPFSHLRALFEQCADLPPGERTRWLDAHVSDTGQRIEIELMLAADAGGDGFLRRDVVSHIGQLSDAQEQEFGPESLVGRRFGAFELERLIGRGGQGAVYLARRTGSDFEQTAAVKLLRRGLHDSAEHKRFRREREILARFEHAGVARLIDGGVSGEGVPYLVMEYVEGLPIDQWCAQQGLDRSVRLRLFVELCEVVAAAQRALIVHRDLKPSNVLVTNEGRIKVLDFGIARLLDEDEVSTQTNAPVLTPGYGAPEQESGGVITLATDVHALGVLLRVLLTGVTPKRAGAGVQGLPDNLPPELRWMLGKACAAEPERRYRDAAELGEDVARFLAAQPVRAHPPSRWYSVRKFVARHRGGVLTSVAVLLGLLASFSLALWQAKVAREQAQRAEATRDFLLGIFQAAEEDLPRDARPTPDVLARAAAKKLEGDTRLSAESRADFLGALGLIAKNGSDYTGAVEYYDRALKALDAVADRSSRQRLDLEIKRAWSLNFLGREKEAVQALQPRLTLLRSVHDDIAADGLWAYAAALADSGRFEEALTHVREAAVLAEQVYPPDSADALRPRLAESRVLTQMGELKQGTAVLAATMQRWRSAGVPQDQDYATAIANLGLLKRRLGDQDGAIDLLRLALALSRRIHPDMSEDNALNMQFLGRMLAERGDFDEAEPLLRDAAKAIAGLFEPNHPLAIGTLSAEGIFDYERQRFDDAIAVLQRSVEICTQARLDKETRCIFNWQLLSATLLRLNRVEEAATAGARSLELRRGLVGETGPDFANALRAQGDVQLAQQQPAAALATFDRSLAVYAKAGIEENIDIASLYVGRARALLALDRAAEALDALQRAQAMTQRLTPHNRGRQLRLLATHAEVLATLGKSAASRSAASQALALEAARGVLDPGEWDRLLSLAR